MCYNGYDGVGSPRKPHRFPFNRRQLACDGDTVWLEVFAGGGTIDATGEYQFDWSSDVNFGTSGAPFVMANASASMIALIDGNR